MTRHKIIVVASECVRQHYQTQRTQPDNNEKKNPNVNKYLNKANTVVAAVDSFIMIMRCDLTLRSIWFSFELLLCSMGRLAWPSLQYTWKKRNQFSRRSTSCSEQLTGCKLWCSEIRVRTLSFHFRPVWFNPADGVVHARAYSACVYAQHRIQYSTHTAYNGFPLLADGGVKQLLLSINYRSQWCDENF